MNFQYRLACFIGCGAYLGMLVLAWIWWDLRTVFLDISFHLFLILKDNALTIQSNRFAAFFTQLFPLVGARLHFNLELIAKLYSLSFVLLPLLVFAISAFVLNRPRMALVLLFTNTLFVTDTFFWIQSELPQGLAWMTLGFACLDGLNERKIKLAWMVAIGILFCTAAFAHPLLLFPFVFSIVFLWLNKTSGFDRRDLAFAGVFFGAMVLVKKYFFRSWYDARATDNVRRVTELFPNYFNLDTNEMFAHNVLHYYYGIPGVLGAVLLLYVSQRKWSLLVWTVGFVLGYLLFVNICMSGSDPKRFYIENMYLPVGMMLALPLVFGLLPALSEKRMALTLVLIIVVVFFIRLGGVKPVFQERLDWMSRWVDLHRNEKLIVPESSVPMDTLLMTWGSPYESWMLSTMKYGETASLMIHHNPSELSDAAKTKNGFVGQFSKVIPYSDFPKRYFVFNDSVTEYHLIEH